MYDFHYNYIKKKYHNKAKLLFTDTDSLTYEISYCINKISLSCFDDKRYILEDGIHSYAYGHYRIQQNSLVGEPSNNSGTLHLPPN